MEKEHKVGADHPLKTISAAAELAQPGDTITVHAGVYRERVDPPRGGTSDTNRITYQVAPGEKVVVTGAEPRNGWEKVGGDAWKVVVPNSYFGIFNPFSHEIKGEWCTPTGRHAGSVYLNGEWLEESLTLDPVLKPVGKSPLWYAEVGGNTKDDGKPLFAIKSFTVAGKTTEAVLFAKKYGEVRPAPEKDSIGWTRPGDWVAYEGFDLSKEQTIAIEAGALGNGGKIEFHAGLGTPEEEFLGRVTVTKTGGWRKWESFSAPLRATSFPANRTLYMLFSPPGKGMVTGNATTVWAQFPGVNPNEADVEISKRQSVFYPSKTGINYITVRGFELCRAATPWGGAMSEQVGLIGTHWSKGWVIENNHIHHSMCKGVALGRYELPAGELPPASAPGFVKSVEFALRDGWSKERVGGHIVRKNRIHHCEKNAIHGSLGGVFSEISGNEIHDIALTGWVLGADIGAIKFLGSIDMVIRDNLIRRCGGRSGAIWLDWMAQGTRVTGNLIYGNVSPSVFVEVNHGPFLFDNNIIVGSRIKNWSQGGAYCYNIIPDAIVVSPQTRETPYHRPHSTEVLGLSSIPGGDDRYLNNLMAQPDAFDSIKQFKNMVVEGNHPVPSAKILEKDDGVYLSFELPEIDPTQPVTAERLGKTLVSQTTFENPDGSPMKIASDYFGKPRDPANPGAGPFAGLKPGRHEIKVWPKDTRTPANVADEPHLKNPK